MNNNAERVFNRWKASLALRQRDSSHIQANFEELFGDIYSTGASLEEAEKYIDQAVKAHAPDRALILRQYKMKRRYQTLEEFGASWLDFISNIANTAFYSFYDIPMERETVIVRKIEQMGDKIEEFYGKMAGDEYRRQRDYADSFPVVDYTSINVSQVDIDNID